MDFDRNLSLEELENNIYPEPEFLSNLIITCHSLRKKPLKLFEAEDLRIMIGQQLSLNYLVPIAIKFLEKNPFSAGNYYNGDLLSVVLRINKSFWKENKHLYNELFDIMINLEIDIETYNSSIFPNWNVLRHYIL